LTDLANLRRRVNRARNFPENTCAASRALVTWADDILKAGSFSPVEGDSEHVAECMLAVVEALWRERTKSEFYRRRCDLLQQVQSRMRDPERMLVCDVLANGSLLPDLSGARYGLTEEGA